MIPYIIGYLIIGVLIFLTLEDTGLKNDLIQGLRTLSIMLVATILWPVVILIYAIVDYADKHHDKMLEAMQKAKEKL